MAKLPFIGLTALGPVDPDILRSLRTALSKFLLLPVRVLRPRPLPLHTYDLTRHQYNAIQLLEFLLGDGEKTRAFRILGVTAADLFVPILTFVFGDAQVDGKAAIISQFRPRGDAGGAVPSRPVLLGRLIKLGLHELGHTFGLPHCRTAGCLMGFSSNLEKLDRKRLGLCPYCQILLTDYYRDHGLLQGPIPLAGEGAEGQKAFTSSPEPLPPIP
jgi:archaemetzincin